MAEDQKEWLTVREAAELIGVDHQWLERKVSAGRITNYKFGGTAVRIRYDDLMEWIESARRPAVDE